MIGVAILGTGAIARIHAEGYLLFPDRCRIRALCDLYPEKAEALGAEKGVTDAGFCSDFREAVDREEVDLVSICLPPSMHAETAIYALEAGKHVLIEKPMASSLEECDAILAAAEKSGRKLSVVSQNRFRTPMMRLKGVIDSGRAGRILHTAVNSYWWRGQNYYDLWWRGTWEKESGGCTINHAVHHADLLLWMLGMPLRTQSFFTNLHHSNSETEDFSTSILSYPGGPVAQLTASLVHHGEEQEMIFQGEHARISFPWKTAASKPRENGFPESDPETERALTDLYESIPPLAVEGHPAQIENVLSAIDSGTELLTDGEAGRRTLELIIGIYKSAATGSAVDFPLGRSDPFYRAETMLPQLPRFHKKTKSRENFGSSDITLGRTH